MFVYDGHVRQGSSAPPTDVSISGFRVSGSPARVGVTAYEGDNGTGGDQFLINGRRPTRDRVDDELLRLRGQRRPRPAYPNNFSVDAKKLTVPDGVPSGATSARSTVTSGDTYLAQNLAFSMPVPELQVGMRTRPRRTPASR